MEPCHKDVMVKRFKGGQGEGLTSKTFAHPVTIFTDSSVLEIKKDGEVVLMNSKFERSTLKVDTVVLADVAADDSLLESYRAAGLLVTKIGDAKKVRNLRGAVTDGANAAFILGKEIQLNANEEIRRESPHGHFAVGKGFTAVWAASADVVVWERRWKGICILRDIENVDTHHTVRRILYEKQAVQASVRRLDPDGRVQHRAERCARSCRSSASPRARRARHGGTS